MTDDGSMFAILVIL